VRGEQRKVWDERMVESEGHVREWDSLYGGVLVWQNSLTPAGWLGLELELTLPKFTLL